MALATDDVLTVTYNYSMVSQQLMNVLHYRIATPPSGTPNEFLATKAIADFLASPLHPLTAALIAVTPDNILMQNVRVQKVKPTRSIYAQTAIAEYGTYAGNAKTPNVCASIEKRSSVVGRKGVGRLQWPPLTDDTMSNGLVQDALILGPGPALLTTLIANVTLIGTYAMTLTPCLPAGGANHGYDLIEAGFHYEVRTMHRRTVGLGI